jgi:hypothetical protein
MNEYGLDICGTNMKLFELNNIWTNFGLIDYCTSRW